jgi:hypothetical protein
VDEGPGGSCASYNEIDTWLDEAYMLVDYNYNVFDKTAFGDEKIVPYGDTVELKATASFDASF